MLARFICSGAHVDVGKFEMTRGHIYIYMYDRETFRVYLLPWVLLTIYIYNLNYLNNLNPAHLNDLNSLT